MIFNQQPPAQGGGGGETLYTVTAPEACIFYGGYESGEYVGYEYVSAADFPEGVAVVLNTTLVNVDVACEDYPEGGFTEVIELGSGNYCFMMPPFDCWILGE